MSSVFKSFSVELPVISQNEYPITSYGAVEGGLVSNTISIRRAVEAAAGNGGGRVVIPHGIWLTGPIRLLSDTELHLEEGALLLFDKNPEEYPLIVTEYEGQTRLRCISPIHAEGAENIAITGNGTIDGNGHLWRMAKEFKFTPGEWARLKQSSPNTFVRTDEGEMWFPSKSAYEGYLAGEPDMTQDPEKLLSEAAPHYDFFRPVMVSFIHCSKILIEGVTLQNSPAWNVHPLFCDNITIRNASIRNPWYAQNGDGLDLESCRLADIHHVCFDVGDDAICMKSGRNAPARKIPVPTEDVHIHNCTVYHGHGGFSVGSEMSRGVRNILVENCTFIGTDTGIRFKSSPGRGGVIENITLKNINMVRIVNEAILFTFGYTHHILGSQTDSSAQNNSWPLEDIPEIRDITLSSITCMGAGLGLRIEGLPVSPIHDITLDRVRLTADSTFSIKDARHILFRQTTFTDSKSGITMLYENQNMDEACSEAP